LTVTGAGTTFWSDATLVGAALADCCPTRPTTPVLTTSSAAASNRER
jgi:hypothetical protein